MSVTREDGYEGSGDFTPCPARVHPSELQGEIGLTWLATVPPTAGLVGKLFGPRHLATLFGLTLLSQQICGFLGAWFGGVSFGASGNYMWMWYADIALAIAAAAVNLPLRETHPRLDAAHA
jgi:hypothetical protein